MEAVDLDTAKANEVHRVKKELGSEMRKKVKLAYEAERAEEKSKLDNERNKAQ